MSYRDRVGSAVSCDFFQVDVLRLRSQGRPYMMKVEQIVTQLEQADQVTQQTLDDMLCHTPTGKRKPIMEERKTSRRTLKPLQSTLLSEWEKLFVVPLTKSSDMKLNRTLILARVALSTSPETQIQSSLGRLDLFPFCCRPYPKFDEKGHSLFLWSTHFQQKAAERKLQFCTEWFGKNVLCVYIKVWMSD